MTTPVCQSANQVSLPSDDAPSPPTPPSRFRESLWGLVSEIEYAHERDVAELRAHFRDCAVTSSDVGEFPAPQMPHRSGLHRFRPTTGHQEAGEFPRSPNGNSVSDPFHFGVAPNSYRVIKNSSESLLGIPTNSFGKNGHSRSGSKLAERRGVSDRVNLTLASVGAGPSRSICGTARRMQSEDETVRYSSRPFDSVEDSTEGENGTLSREVVGIAVASVVTPTASASASPGRHIANSPLNRLSSSPLNRLSNSPLNRLSVPKARRQTDASTASTSIIATSSQDRGSMLGSTLVVDTFCQVHPDWIDMLDDCSSPSRMHSSTAFGRSESSATGKNAAYNLKAEQKRRMSITDPKPLKPGRINCASLMTYPNSRYRLVWDLIGMILLSYDIIMVPMQVYDDQEEPFMTVMNVITGCFWTADLTSSFFVGYHTQGYIEMRPAKVAIHYIRGWFLLDIMLVTLDWFFLILGFNSQAKLLRFGKVGRGLRVLRLLRLAKLHILASTLSERIQSEYKRTMLGIAKLLVFITMINHFVACVWYGLGTLELYNERWIDVHIRPNDDIWYKYTTSLHWSLTQFTPASMEVVPRNTLERTYSVIVLLFALVTFSSFVSSITNAMTHLRNINARRFEQDSVLRRYLTEHNISSLLVNSVLHFIKERQMQKVRQVRTKEQDVEMFKILPDSVRNQLRLEAFMPTLRVHPLFSHLQEIDEDFILRLCRTAIEESTLLVRQELFGDGAEVTHMVFVSSGVLRYLYSEAGVERVDYVKADQWCCEVALWSKSAPLDRPFVAHQSNCELLLVGAGELRKICKRFQPTWYEELVAYAENYMALIEGSYGSCSGSMIHRSRTTGGGRSASFLCNDPELIRDSMLAWQDLEALHDSQASRSQEFNDHHSNIFARARQSVNGLWQGLTKSHSADLPSGRDSRSPSHDSRITGNDSKASKGSNGSLNSSE